MNEIEQVQTEILSLQKAVTTISTTLTEQNLQACEAFTQVGQVLASVAKSLIEINTRISMLEASRQAPPISLFSRFH